MKFTEKLDVLMREQGITRGGLADRTGIPYNTIVGFYTKGYSNIKLSNLSRIASYFKVPLDILADDSRGLEEHRKNRETGRAVKKIREPLRKGERHSFRYD